jgi:hypothetical protein
MTKRQGKDKKVFKSFEEYVKEYYPNSWKERLRNRQTETCDTCGTGLVPEIFNAILKNIKPGRVLNEK